MWSKSCYASHVHHQKCCRIYFVLWQKEEPCLDISYYEAHDQVQGPAFQDLQFNDPQQAFQVRPMDKPTHTGNVLRDGDLWQALGSMYP